jgi:SAM-dependent methyltransferase
MAVVGVDPAAASLELARTKPGADLVRWILGDATALPALQADLALMTGNVAQVFVSDDEWDATLRAVGSALRRGGLLVFETRDPSRQAWLGWTREQSFDRRPVDGLGEVESWVEVTDVAIDQVSFRWTFRLLATDETLVSDSTLRFRSHEQLERSLERAGFTMREVRDAPDRPGAEWVFLAERST